MRAAVYNQHLSTMGGGERYTGMLAAVLGKHVPQVSQVDLVGHGDVTLPGLEEHLGIAMPGVSLRVVPDRGEAWVSALSADYDLFVNSSYMSRVRSQAPRSLYAVYFPTPWDHDLTPGQKRLSRLLGPWVTRSTTPYEIGLGWFPPEGGRRRSWSWTSGEGELFLAPGEATSLSFQVGRPGAPATAEVLVEVEDHVVARRPAEPGRFAGVEVIVPASDRPRRVRLLSDVFTPPPPDRRELGVAVSSIRLDGRRDLARAVAGRLPYLLRDSHDLSFLGTYDQVVSISRYTADWVERLWHVPSEVLYPPVHTTAVRPGAKARQVLSIGRFFGTDRGHSKKQLEMVRAFVAAQDGGDLADWEYHLVGGCSEEDLGYLEQVRSAAAGHPVHLHVNAPRSRVEELLGSASVFWHATGLGEDPDDRPWSMEHFGITTVEAMAAGCVPVVIARAGQREIVTDGVDGYLFETTSELVARTAALSQDPARRERMAAAAAERAHAFSEHAFADRFTGLVQGLLERT